MQLHKKVIEQYAAARRHTYKQIVCHAPFANLNFEQNGNVRACCYNTKDILGSWPQQSIREIWFGEAVKKLRQHIRDNDLGGGCTECGKMIIAGNHQGVRAKYFDEYATDNLSTKIRYARNKWNGHIGYPRVMEFELSNECNLECVMCNGYFSSNIRKKREHLPPIISPYNQNFVDELDEFIPHLTDAKFLGGEPFMIELYLKIWERMAQLKPSARIHITTNGTFLNSRIKNLLEGLKAGIIVSIDSVNKETYEKIRVNGNFSKVMDNLEHLMDYTRRKRTFISIAACPITYNWNELPQMLSFCLEKNIALYFNAVFSPAELSLREQSSSYLEEVISFLKSVELPAIKNNPQSPRNLSIRAYSDFILLLNGWLNERKALEKQSSVQKQPVKADLKNRFAELKEVTWTIGEVRSAIEKMHTLQRFGYEDKEKEFLSYAAGLFAATPSGKTEAVVESYLVWFSTHSGVEVLPANHEKLKRIATLIEAHPKRKEILMQLSQASPSGFAESITKRSIDDLAGDLQRFFV